MHGASSPSAVFLLQCYQTFNIVVVDIVWWGISRNEEKGGGGDGLGSLRPFFSFSPPSPGMHLGIHIHGRSLSPFFLSLPFALECCTIQNIKGNGYLLFTIVL